MFGYIVVHKPELKVREYETYRASYCGLCHSLKKQSGRIGQLTLSFDMTFLALLLTGLYEPETVTKSARCIAHPVEKHFYRENRYFDYAADMNVLLTYYKCLDDWQDERKLTACLFGQALKGNVKKLAERYERQSRCLRDNLAALSAYEKEKQYDIDKTAGFFGAIMAELFVYAEDEWAEKLRRMGFYFGKFIYLMYELKKAIDVYTYKTGDRAPVIEKIQTISTTSTKKPDNLTAACAMRMSVDQKYIYCTNAGENTISVYKRDEETGLLTMICCLPISGAYPKDVAVFPDGRHIASVNHDSGTISFFKVDYEKGLLVMSGRSIPVNEPNCCAIVKIGY